jgi:hypothetical protein
MTSLLSQGLSSIATPLMREQCAEVLYLDAAGHSVLEIAAHLKLKRSEVEGLRELAGDRLIWALRESGYSTAEIVRTLGVATARVLPPIAA